MPHALRHLLRDVSGATAVEYGLLAALIALAILGSLEALFNGAVAGLYGSSVQTILAAFGA